MNFVFRGLLSGHIAHAALQFFSFFIEPGARRSFRSGVTHCARPDHLGENWDRRGGKYSIPLQAVHANAVLVDGIRSWHPLPRSG